MIISKGRIDEPKKFRPIETIHLALLRARASVHHRPTHSCIHIDLVVTGFLCAVPVSDSAGVAAGPVGARRHSISSTGQQGGGRGATCVDAGRSRGEQDPARNCILVVQYTPQETRRGNWRRPQLWPLASSTSGDRAKQSTLDVHHACGKLALHGRAMRNSGTDR